MRRSTALRFLVALLLPLFLAAACSSDDDDSATAPTEQGDDAADSGDGDDSGDTGDGGSGDDNGCVNTEEEVSEAFGVEVTEAENITNPGVPGGSCIYHTDKASGESAMATTRQSGDVANSVFASYAADDSSEKVGGIGDEAIWFGQNSTFMILKGDTVLSMSAGASVPNSNDPEAMRAILEGLARKAADRL